MNNDKLLLKKAAKAAGIELEYDGLGHYGYYSEWRGLPQWNDWNPLTDDGDALRLAVKLDIDLQIGNGISAAQAPSHDELQCYFYCSEAHNGDPYAATRQAIVRAAAEIGKEIK